MKKLLTLILAVLLLFTLTACNTGSLGLDGGSGSSGTDGSRSNSNGGNNNGNSSNNNGTGVGNNGSNNDIPQGPTGEFLYAQLNYGGSYPNIENLTQVASATLFFVGNTVDAFLPPDVNDFVLFRNGTPTDVTMAYMSQGYSLYTENAFHELNKHVPRDHEMITLYTISFSHIPTEPGEYRVEATINGIKMGSDTFVWRTDDTGEYLNDMPKPASLIKLTARPRLVPLTPININPNEQGFSYVFSPFAINNNDWVYYSALIDYDSNSVGERYNWWKFFRMKHDGSGLEEIDIAGIAGHADPRSVNIVNEWIYFSSWNMNQIYGGVPNLGLYRCRLDGSDLSLFLDLSDGGSVSNIQIHGEWLYYDSIDNSGAIDISGASGFSNPTLYRVRVSDGSEHMKVSDNVPHYQRQIVGDWLYFVDTQFSNAAVIRVKTDGSQQREEFMMPDVDGIGNVRIDGDWIYYTGMNNDKWINSHIANTLYKININTREVVELIAQDCGWYMISDGWIYYTYTGIASDDIRNILHRMRTDGTSRTHLGINEEVIGHFNVVGDWIFYDLQWDEDFYGIPVYRARVDGTGSPILIGMANW
ncbi:MAG: DUF5050 domain-containing protein [Lachnospiraceae bacterium]|jgi:hypothetical protein|nr:DUF5050 domain-containing protein [Lachnospiraceae bacterium]